MTLGLKMERFQLLARRLEGMDYRDAAKAGVHPDELDAIRAMRLTGIEPGRIDALMATIGGAAGGE